MFYHLASNKMHRYILYIKYYIGMKIEEMSLRSQRMKLLEHTSFSYDKGKSNTIKNEKSECEDSFVERLTSVCLLYMPHCPNVTSTSGLQGSMSIFITI